MFSKPFEHLMTNFLKIFLKFIYLGIFHGIFSYNKIFFFKISFFNPEKCNKLSHRSTIKRDTRRRLYFPLLLDSVRLEYRSFGIRYIWYLPASVVHCIVQNFRNQAKYSRSSHKTQKKIQKIHE